MDGPGRDPGQSAEYRGLIERLLTLSKKGSHFGLEPLARVLDALGHPELRFPAIHVVGSNGKGSTAAFTAAILAASGQKVGLYTSPHLISLTERIAIFGAGSGPIPISEASFVAACAQLEAVAPGFEALTFFEAITAAAFLYFAERRVDVAVIEAGLGARLDATRLCDARVAVITDLALEHREILGDTLAEIALEKAHAARPGRPLIVADGDPEAQAVIDAHAEVVGAKVLRLGRDFPLTRHPLGLLGPHQVRNASLAVQAALQFEPTLGEAWVRAGLSHARWPGRMELFEKKGQVPVLLDGAHNAHGARALAAALAADERFLRPLHFVIGVLADKDAEALLAALLPSAASLTFTQPATSRARPPSELLALIPQTSTVPAQVIAAPAEALAAARAAAERTEGWVVVCGSLYLVGELRTLLL